MHSNLYRRRSKGGCFEEERGRGKRGKELDKGVFWGGKGEGKEK